MHDGALSQLKLQVASIEPGPIERGPHRLDQILLPELLRRQVDSDPQLAQAFGRVARQPGFWDMLRSDRLDLAIFALEPAQKRLMVDEGLLREGAPGEYSLFIDLKPNNWTLVVSSWGALQKYDPNDKTGLWGSYFYTPDKDLLRVPMKLETLPHSREQLTWEFVT